MRADILVVAKSQPSLYAYLRQDFAEDPDVEVVIDRRHGERRQRREPWTAERRSAERRTRPVEQTLQSMGFAIVRPG